MQTVETVVCKRYAILFRTHIISALTACILIISLEGTWMDPFSMANLCHEWPNKHYFDIYVLEDYPPS